MGWSYGKNMDGKEVGYSVQAVCEQPDCDAKIDRGLAYACGDDHGGGDGFCDGYFCYRHLSLTSAGQRCPRCESLLLEEAKQ